jgi:hypothetical protein
MLRYIAYVGPKSEKRIQDDSKRWHEFPRGVTVDAIELGFSEERIKFLLKSGVFQLRSSANEVRPKVTVPDPNEPKVKPMIDKALRPDRNICGTCGFVAKSPFGLQAHQRRHKNAG